MMTKKWTPLATAWGLGLGAWMSAAVSLASPPHPVSEAAAEAPFQGSISDPVRYEIDFSAVVTAPYQTKLLKVWMPIPPSDEVQQISGTRWSTFPESVEAQVAREPVYGNRFAYFEFHNPQGAQIIRHRFTATVANVNWNLDPEKVAPAGAMPAAFQPYMTPQPIVASAEFQKVLAPLTSRFSQSAEGFFQTLDWLDANLRYDHRNASLQADAAHAFTHRGGHCSDYHGLCATMGRALGFPTRMTYGLSLYPKNSPSHCKLEAFLAPYGWVSFDVSETQQMIQRIRADESLGSDQRDTLASAARARLWSGFRENRWLLLTRGADYELAPRASRPVRVVRTIYAEADGEALPEPDPADSTRREYSWMTVHQYKADREVRDPFRDRTTLTP